MAAQPQEMCGVGGSNIGMILVLSRDSKKVQLKDKTTAGIRIRACSLEGKGKEISPHLVPPRSVSTELPE